ncbi:hypothetical protein ACROYT_G024160 [Oculina patagonica]
MFFILLFSVSFTWFSTTRGELQAVCSSGMTVLKNHNASTPIKLTGRLSNDTNLHGFCVLKMDKPDTSFLQVRAKRNDNSTGFLHIFLHEAGGSSMLGHVDVSKPAPAWNTLTVSLPRSVQTSQEKYMSVTGTSGVSFAVEVTQTPSEISLNTPQTVNLEKDSVIVFQFSPPKGISDTQLDITVTSQSNVPAYLKVSQIYQDVHENIEVVDYKPRSHFVFPLQRRDVLPCPKLLSRL